MKLITKDRLASYTKVLLWLYDRQSGTATLGEVSQLVFGTPTAKSVVAVARAMTTRGWAECAEQDQHGTYIWIFDRTISLLPAGRIWADFLLHGGPAKAWTVSDMWAYIRALQRALEPFAEYGCELRKTRGPARQHIKKGFARQHYEMAADVLRPYTEGATVYPWMPEKTRDRPWLQPSSQHNASSPSVPPAPSASSS